MTDRTAENAPSEQVEYVETVVEYVDNRRQRALLGIVFVILFLLLIGVAYAVMQITKPKGAPGKSAGANGMTWVRSIYGWGPGIDKALKAPTDVAIAPNGTIWTISQHHYIVGFNPDGSVRKVISPKVGLSLEGIDVAENGDLFVTDFGGQLIQFHPDGQVVTTWQVQLPNEVDVRGDKIAVAGANGIAVFTPDDKVLLKLGTRGQGKNQFDLPHGILIGPEGNVYVSDTQNQRVRAFSASGREMWTNGTSPDRSKGNDVRDTKKIQTFELPAGLAMDGRGRLVVIDPFKFQIIVLDAKTGKQWRAGNKPKGKLAVFGEMGMEESQFTYPTGIAYDRTRDWFAVADTGNNRIQIVRIPESGGMPGSHLIGAFRAPMLVFLIPWLLLLIPIGLQLTRRKRERELAAADADKSAA